MVDVRELLDERAKVYGDFSCIAQRSQLLKTVVSTSTNWDRLSCEHREALEFICNKIARIIEGRDLNYVDSWHDIAGYAMLAVDKIRRSED